LPNRAGSPPSGQQGEKQAKKKVKKKVKVRMTDDEKMTAF
jgi:hypothetical protein